MADIYQAGSRVEVSVKGKPYYGYIITYDEALDPIMYQVSLIGIGDVLTVGEEDITLIAKPGGGGGGDLPLPLADSSDYEKIIRDE